MWLSLPHPLHFCQHGETFYRNILPQNCTWNTDVGNTVKYAESSGSTLDKGPFYIPKLSQAFYWIIDRVYGNSCLRPHYLSCRLLFSFSFLLSLDNICFVDAWRQIDGKGLFMYLSIYG